MKSLAVDGTGSDPKEETKKICREKVDFVVDAVGINQLINQAMKLLKYNGHICCY